MALRRKERPLTPEELREKLTTQNSPHWFRIEPLCALASNGVGEKQLLSLSATTDKELLVICLLDAGDHLSDRMVEIMAKWKERYFNIAWRPVLVFEQKYLFLKNQRFFERFKHISAFSVLPIYLDPEGAWFRHFEVIQGPKILFLNQGRLIFSKPLRENFAEEMKGIEDKLQETFRLDDPGMPLPTVEPTELNGPVDHLTLGCRELEQHGHWMISEGSIATDDSQASVSFKFSGKKVRLIATTHPKAREATKVQIFLNDQPLPANISGEHIHMNDKGQAVMEINRNAGVYELIDSETPLNGIIKVKIVNGVENPVIIYELRVT